jgi:hypothetical protein
MPKIPDTEEYKSDTKKNKKYILRALKSQAKDK